MELLHNSADRPSWVYQDEGRVFISVHDAEHLRIRKIWRGRLSRAHAVANRGGSSRQFLQVKASYDKWLRGEQQWYALYGLDLPKDKAAKERGPTEICPMCRRSPGCRILRYKTRNPGVTDQQIADALSTTIGAVRKSLHRSKTHPSRAACRKCSLLKILADGALHPVEELRAQLGVTDNLLANIVRDLFSQGYSIEHVRRGTANSYHRYQDDISELQTTVRQPRPSKARTA